MKAVVCNKFGPPEDLRIETLDAPTLNAGEVRIQVHACGVNFPDFLIVAGKYQVRPPLPFTPGAELSGEIIETADDVSYLQPGQRVLAMVQTGAMAEEVCVAAGSVVPIPDNMSFTIAAGFILTYGTAYHALKQRAQLSAGESLLVLGAGGGVGLAAVELGALTGATVYGAASTTEKRNVAIEHGAAEAFDYRETSLKDRINELTAGKGVDVIFDPVGGEIFNDCLRAVAWNGRILVVGFAGGDIQSIPANLPLLKGSAVLGVFWGRFTTEEPAASAENIQELLQMYSQGKISPHISQSYPLEQSAAAIRHLADRKAIGKIVIEI